MRRSARERPGPTRRAATTGLRPWGWWSRPRTGPRAVTDHGRPAAGRTAGSRRRSIRRSRRSRPARGPGRCRPASAPRPAPRSPGCRPPPARRRSPRRRRRSGLPPRSAGSACRRPPTPRAASCAALPTADRRSGPDCQVRLSCPKESVPVRTHTTSGDARRRGDQSAPGKQPSRGSDRGYLRLRVARARRSSRRVRPSITVD